MVTHAAVCRTRPRIVMQYAFNRWEFLPEPDKMDLMPAPLPKSTTSDFWWCRVKVSAAARCITVLHA